MNTGEYAHIDHDESCMVHCCHSTTEGDVCCWCGELERSHGPFLPRCNKPVRWETTTNSPAYDDNNTYVRGD